MTYIGGNSKTGLKLKRKIKEESAKLLAHKFDLNKEE